MTFYNPLAGYLLLILVPLCFLYGFAGIRRKRSLTKFAGQDLLPALIVPLDGRNRMKRFLLFLLTLALGIFALMRPQFGFDWEQGGGKGLNILVAIDTSRSMLTEDLKPNRLEKAKQAAREFAGTLRGDRIGLIAFSGEAFLVCPLTGDTGGFLQSLESLEAGILPLGGTSISTSIEAAVKGFGKAQGEKILLLLTDGEDHEGDAVSAARSAHKAGVRIYTAGFGTGEGGLIPVTENGNRKTFLKDSRGNAVKSVLREEVLVQIAKSSGGTYIPGSGITSLYQDVLSKLDPGTLEGRLKKRARERFQIPLALTLLLITIPIFAGRREPLPSESHKRNLFRVISLSLMLFALSCGKDLTGEAYRHFLEGKNDEALKIYETILPGQPDSALLNFNMGVLLYRKESFSRAVEHFNRVLLTDDPALESNAAYNLGNCKVRLADAALKTDPEKAMDLYLEARDYYSRALDLNERDSDSRINLGIVEKRIHDLEVLPPSRPETRGEEKKKSPSQDDQKISRAPKEAHFGKADGKTGKETELTREAAEALLEKHQGEESFWSPSAAKKRTGPFPADRKDW
jgi:Ca-activated chloride channel family protein